MISTKATTGIEHIDFNKVCNLVKNDLMTKFADTVRSVGKVKHKVNPAIPTISIVRYDVHQSRMLSGVFRNLSMGRITGGAQTISSRDELDRSSYNLFDFAIINNDIVYCPVVY